MKLSPEELALLTPEEAAALQDTGAETALATMADQKPAATAGAAGTTEEVETEADADEGDAGNVTTPEAAAATEAAPAQPAADAVTPEAASAALEELDTAAAPPAPPAAFDVPATDFKAQRDTLRTEKRDLAKKWSDGELSDDDYHSAVEAVDDKMATLLAEQTRADTLREVNEQNARRAAEAQEKAELAAMAAVAAAAKKAGQVDYGTDKAAAVEFDSLFAAAKASPANASLTPAQLVEKAHKAVLALRGIAAAPAPAPAAAAPAAPAAPAPRAAPPSIGGLPNAAPAVVQDDLMAQFSNLEGEDAERFLAGLPANQVAKLMRTTDNLGIH